MKSTRRLIQKSESKVSVLQIFGFLLILLGVISLIISSFQHGYTIPPIIAVSFFITMLGFSFAFPSLLESNDGLSTMRIVVFMVTNVICMLLLKIGWADGIKDLKSIGLDQYWMGVIAFVFGAKATQSFFESKMAKLIEGKPSAIVGKTDSQTNYDNLETADTKIINEALDEKGEEWVASFPYVTGFSVRNKIIDNVESNNVALIFKVTAKPSKLEYGRIPEYIVYKSKTGKSYKILTDVIKEETPTGSVKIKKDEEPFPLGNSISRRDEYSTGSIGLVVNQDDDNLTNYVVSCYHVFCAPELKSGNKTFENANNAPVICASAQDHGSNYIGDVVMGKINNKFDFAIAKINDGIKLDNSIELADGTITPSAFGYVLDKNKGDTLTLCGRSSGVSHGLVKSLLVPQTIWYVNHTVSQYLQGLIEVTKFSTKGDSGGIVINSNNEIVGLLIADSDISSYVLPVENFLTKNNYSLKTTNS